MAVSPAIAPITAAAEGEGNWKRFESSVNAVSFGFVATAILISMFLVMAIVERFLRPRSADGFRRNVDVRIAFDGKLDHPSSKMMASASDVSVLMPGEVVPTFIAHPVPPPSQNQTRFVISGDSVR
ncbi:hypothetical protein Nepgr_000447 [Nepenthes gracilis]|uniref:Uncharacterized protein n=1 Tax=Nepenthes gracilis TaxID=150966 RepID=A0AAD3RWU6_NEPGR|nr:hypothetical protein Nepgr_000447 [Nepenthes gracilis]